MIRITRQTDYGIILLTYLAGRPQEQVHTARDVAEAAGLPLPIVSKILKGLARGGLLVTKRGVKGGYGLAQPAESITLAQVIRALEGPIGMTDCTSPPGSCEWEPRCPVKVNWQRISGAGREALENNPLSEVGGPAG